MLSVGNPISSSCHNIAEEVRTSYCQLKKMILGSDGGSDIFIGYFWKLFKSYNTNKEMVSKLYLFVDEMAEGGVDSCSDGGGVMDIGLVEKLIICSLFLMEIGKPYLCSSSLLRLEDVLGNVTMEFSLHYSTVSEVPSYFIKVLNEMKDRFDNSIEELDLLLENFNISAEPDSPHHLPPPPPLPPQKQQQQQFTNTSLTSMTAISNNNTTNTTKTFLQIKRRRNDSVFSSSILSDGRCYQLDVNTNDFYQCRPMSQPIPIKSTMKKKKKVDRTIILMTPPHIRKCDIVRWTMDNENGSREDQKIEHKMNNLELADCAEDRIQRNRAEQHEDEDECFKIL